MSPLSKEEQEKYYQQLWELHVSLSGIGGLFTQGQRDVCFDDGEFYGIGVLIKKLSRELEEVERNLRHGKDPDSVS